MKTPSNRKRNKAMHAESLAPKRINFLENDRFGELRNLRERKKFITVRFKSIEYERL